MCSYCSQEEETEVHLYTNCMVTNVFWKKAAQWYEQTFHVKVPLGLKIPRILGMDNERSSDLRNIFYRNARYCIQGRFHKKNAKKSGDLPNLPLPPPPWFGVFTNKKLTYNFFC